MNPIHPLLGDFMGTDFCILVEESPSIVANIQRSLQDMGLSSRQILVARKYFDAEKMIREKRPKLVVTEYEIDGQMGLDLIQLQEEFYTDGEILRVIVTKVKTEAAISAAAEEHVDVFILKPFSIETFAQRVDEAVFRKQNPSEYVKKIQEGKKALKLGEFESAERIFIAAKGLDVSPASACYYLGQTYEQMGLKAEALAFYREGRKFQPLNYKCLVGEFEFLLQEGRFSESLVVAPALMENFPITSSRLEQIFEAVLGQKDYLRLKDLHPLFMKIESRPSELVALASQAYYEGAMTLLKMGDGAHALAMSEMLFAATTNDFAFIDKIVRAFLVAKLPEAAMICFKKVSAAEMGSPRYKLLEFVIDELNSTPDQIVEKARRLIADENVSPEIFTSAVVNCKKIGKVTLAESIIAKAVIFYPEMRGPLYKILEGT